MRNETLKVKEIEMKNQVTFRGKLLCLMLIY